MAVVDGLLAPVAEAVYDTSRLDFASVVRHVCVRGQIFFDFTRYSLCGRSGAYWASPSRTLPFYAAVGFSDFGSANVSLSSWLRTICASRWAADTGVQGVANLMVTMLGGLWQGIVDLWSEAVCTACTRPGTRHQVLVACGRNQIVGCRSPL
jgi:hypothetical protein